MNVTVALEVRYTVTPDGSVWSRIGMGRQFWERYLEVFDTVTIVARATLADAVSDDWERVDCPNIRLHKVPDFHGPWEFVKSYPAVRRAVRSAIPESGAVILRAASQIANTIEAPLYRKSYPYGLEVIGDPHDVFARGVVDHPLRPFLRWHFSRRLRQQCLRAAGAAYVTKRALQQRYPTRQMSMSISDVDLPENAVLETVLSTNYPSVELRQEHLVRSIFHARRDGPFRIVTVGSLAQLYKGTDVLIDAVARCVRAGLNLTAIIVGDGKYRDSLMAQAERAGIGSRVEFTGWVTAGDPVRMILDKADLFVLPSRTEGQPRALIEAMARGLPCIASAVGGIPEILDASCTVQKGDPAVLAAKISEVLASPAMREAMSARNLAIAMEFCDTVLAERRRRFYLHIRECTRTWSLRRRAQK